MPKSSGGPCSCLVFVHKPKGELKRRAWAKKVQEGSTLLFFLCGAGHGVSGVRHRREHPPGGQLHFPHLQLRSRGPAAHPQRPGAASRNPRVRGFAGSRVGRVGGSASPGSRGLPDPTVMSHTQDAGATPLFKGHGLQIHPKTKCCSRKFLLYIPW